MLRRTVKLLAEPIDRSARASKGAEKKGCGWDFSRYRCILSARTGQCKCPRIGQNFLAGEFGFMEACCGEHATDPAATITSPAIFRAKLVNGALQRGAPCQQEL